ncbi:hypothetical protein PVAP13_4KG174633 [Panicum virgatum]|uniref:Secreted protein n=1 Tax=Panicum virgatum TaxID=38727 RepID=A0A8T0TM70_PANVG|nr:hypothetical protein PVAP13_4KG174633 [Panicum virgatum]
MQESDTYPWYCLLWWVSVLWWVSRFSISSGSKQIGIWKHANRQERQVSNCRVRPGANPYRNGNLLHSETKPIISAAGSRLTAETVVLNCSVFVKG